LVTNAFALKKGEVNLNGGLGLFGSRGLIGVSGDYFLSEMPSLTGAVGIDVIGVTTTLDRRLIHIPRYLI